MTGGSLPSKQHKIQVDKKDLLGGVEAIKLPVVTHRSLWGRYQPRGNISEADCVVGFSFGYRDHNGQMLPGRSNVRLAEYYRDHLDHLPVFAQLGLGEAISQVTDASRIIEVVYESQSNKDYLDTADCAMQFKELLTKHGYSRPAVLAHAYHLPLADFHLRIKHGLATITPDKLAAYSSFDPDSAQAWTRHPASWRKGILKSAFSTIIPGLNFE